MNKLTFATGGHPLALDDLDFLQDAMLQGFTALSNRDAILIGFRINLVGSGPFAFYELTQGYCMLGGELYYFPGDIGWSAYTNPVIVPVEAIDTGAGKSPVAYADASSQNVHKIRQVELQESAAQPVKYAIADLDVYGDPWHRVGDAADIAGGYIVSTNYGDASDYTYGTSYESLQFRKVGSMLELKGAMQTSSWVNGQVAFTLPSVANHINYRPAKFRPFLAPATVGGDGICDNTQMVSFGADGFVTVTEGSYAGTGIIRIHINTLIQLS